MNVSIECLDLERQSRSKNWKVQDGKTSYRKNWQDVTYQYCEGCIAAGVDLPREVPSTTPPNKRDLTGRAIKICGFECGRINREYAKAEKLLKK